MLIKGSRRPLTPVLYELVLMVLGNDLHQALCSHPAFRDGLKRDSTAIGKNEQRSRPTCWPASTAARRVLGHVGRDPVPARKVTD
jgi:hypothetical protein